MSTLKRIVEHHCRYVRLRNGDDEREIEIIKSAGKYYILEGESKEEIADDSNISIMDIVGPNGFEICDSEGN
jgi:hypothetical protein